MSTVCIIPARGGSKRIPGKNIRSFHGKPVIAWSIQTAFASQCFDRVIVSTDDAQIAGVAKEHGAEVPFVRPQALADDHTATLPVIAHAIGWLNSTSTGIDIACCLYATAPLLRVEDLRRGFDLLAASGADYAVSVARYPHPIQRAMRITAESRMDLFYPEHHITRTQDLEPTYYDAAQFYWGRAGAWLSGAPVLGPRSTPVFLPGSRVQDIDTEDDWIRAEFMYGALNGGAAR